MFGLSKRPEMPPEALAAGGVPGQGSQYSAPVQVQVRPHRWLLDSTAHHSSGWRW